MIAIKKEPPKTLKRTENSILFSDDKGENYELFCEHIVPQIWSSVNSFDNLVISKFW
jgi:hypothetical protein